MFLRTNFNYFAHVWTKSTGDTSAALYFTEGVELKDGTIEYYSQDRTITYPSSYTGKLLKITYNNSTLFWSITPDVSGLTVNNDYKPNTTPISWKYSTRMDYQIKA